MTNTAHKPIHGERTIEAGKDGIVGKRIMEIVAYRTMICH